MAVLNYDHIPGDTVYVVVEGDCVKKAEVLQFSFLTYLDALGQIQENLKYLVLYEDGSSTAFVEPANAYEDIEDALDVVRTNTA